HGRPPSMNGVCGSKMQTSSPPVHAGSRCTESVPMAQASSAMTGRAWLTANMARQVISARLRTLVMSEPLALDREHHLRDLTLEVDQPVLALAPRLLRRCPGDGRHPGGQGLEIPAVHQVAGAADRVAQRLGGVEDLATLPREAFGGVAVEIGDRGDQWLHGWPSLAHTNDKCSYAHLMGRRQPPKSPLALSRAYA